jgi:hypothetical protein
MGSCSRLSAASGRNVSRTRTARSSIGTPQSAGLGLQYRLLTPPDIYLDTLY